MVKLGNFYCIKCFSSASFVSKVLSKIFWIGQMHFVHNYGNLKSFLALKMAILRQNMAKNEKK